MQTIDRCMSHYTIVLLQIFSLMSRANRLTSCGPHASHISYTSFFTETQQAITNIHHFALFFSYHYLTNIFHMITVKLNGENYLFWSAQVIPYLRGQHVFGFVDGTNLPSPPTIRTPTSAPGDSDITPNPTFHIWS